MAEAEAEIEDEDDWPTNGVDVQNPSADFAAEEAHNGGSWRRTARKIKIKIKI